MLSTVDPLGAALLAFLAFGERPAAAQVLGDALVLGGVLVLEARPRPPGQVRGHRRAVAMGRTTA
jgi:drug/metabolite transporter (DMT)-like permease